VVVAAATLAAPPDRLQERLDALHRALPLVGARLHDETWHPGAPPEPLIVDGDPLAAAALVDRFDLAAQPPLRVVVGGAGTRLAVACHHAAFDGLGLVTLLATLAGDGNRHQGGGDKHQNDTDPSARLPLRGSRVGVDHGAGDARPRRRAPELRGLLGRLARPADRVAPSPARQGRESLAVREVALAGPGITARLADAAVAAAGARNARLGQPWRRVGVNLGLPGPPGLAGEAVAGNLSRYRRVDLEPGDPVGPALAAAVASPREPLDQVWSPRFGWLLEPVAGRFSDSLLVSNLGRREVPGATRLDFFPVARGRSAVAVGAAGLPGGPSTVSLRARDLSSEDAEALLADLVARLEPGT
jgi:hypothetical protein